MNAIGVTRIELGAARKAVLREVNDKHEPRIEFHAQLAQVPQDPPVAQPSPQETTTMTPNSKLDSQIKNVLTNAIPVAVEDLDDDDLAIPVEQPAQRVAQKLPELFLPAEPLSHLEQTVMHDLIGTLKGARRHTKTNLAAVTPNIPIDPPLLPTANQRLEPDTLVAELPVVAKPTRQGIVAPQAAPPPQPAPLRAARGTEPRAIAIPSRPFEPIAKLHALPVEPVPMLTPLEQAVHDLVIEALPDRQADDDDRRTIDAVDTSPSMPTIAIGGVLDARPAKVDAPEAIRPREIAQPIDNQNHVHLVIDDGGERVVVTVAVRGDNVNVAMRSSDEGTAAALARNAGSLDHAMRGRGLTLAQLGSDHREDPRQRQQREREEHQRARRAIEEFTLDLEVA